MDHLFWMLKTIRMPNLNSISLFTTNFQIEIFAQTFLFFTFRKHFIKISLWYGTHKFPTLNVDKLVYDFFVKI